MVAVAFDTALGFTRLLVVPNPSRIAAAVGAPNVQLLVVKWKNGLHKYSNGWLCACEAAQVWLSPSSGEIIGN